MKQEVLNFKFGNKKDFFITSKNKLALNLISNWPEWNNQFFFYMALENVARPVYVKYGRENQRHCF